LQNILVLFDHAFFVFDKLEIHNLSSHPTLSYSFQLLDQIPIECFSEWNENLSGKV
jgi:hypothetical protein